MKSRHILVLSFLIIIATAGLVLLSAAKKVSGVMPAGKPVQIQGPAGTSPCAHPAR